MNKKKLLIGVFGYMITSMASITFVGNHIHNWLAAIMIIGVVSSMMYMLILATGWEKLEFDKK